MTPAATFYPTPMGGVAMKAQGTRKAHLVILGAWMAGLGFAFLAVAGFLVALDFVSFLSDERSAEYPKGIIPLLGVVGIGLVGAGIVNALRGAFPKPGDEG